MTARETVIQWWTLVYMWNKEFSINSLSSIVEQLCLFDLELP